MTVHLTTPIIVAGIETRTKAADEMSGNGRILPLWEKYRTEIFGQKIPAGVPIGLYTAYESDYQGAYTLLAGVEVDSAHTPADGIRILTIPAGHYMKFAAKGAMPDIVIGLWQEVWRYFSADTAEFARAYSTDFELYPALGEVEIYISIQPK